MVTTTHDPRGGGRPRLVLKLGNIDEGRDARQREFDLVRGTTVIGSGRDADVRLDGLADHHAEIRRDANDEYVFVNLGGKEPGLVDGQPVEAKPLRTGDRVELGEWTLSYVRDEFADHGIPHGGRHGEERDPVQDEPRPVGSSPEGGRDRAGDDPGEYFP